MIDPQTCTKCHTRNPIGNKFCRECGEVLPVGDNPLLQEEAERAQRERSQERVAALLASAFRKSEAREFDEALKLAGEAAELMPDSTSAYALLATLYERTGQNDKAISAMERVIQLNPDSTADRLKLEQLRRGVHILAVPTGRSYEIEEKPRLAWVPLAAAGGAAAVIFAVLMAVVSAKDDTKQTASAAQPRYAPSYAPPAPVNSGVTPVTANPGYFVPNAPNPIVTPYPIEKLTPSPTPGARNVERARTTTPSGSGAMRLPLPGEVNTNVPPVVMDPPPADQSADGGFGNGVRVPVGPPAERIPVGPPTLGNYPQTNPGANNAPPQGDGYIRIQVNPGTANPPSNPPDDNPPEEAPPPPANPPPAESEQPLSRARRLQTEGRYTEAITAYREALRVGMGAGDAYLGIAQSYQRLGDSSSARGAYGEAIRAFENQISAGRSAGIARQGIATCRAALDVLGG